MSFLHSFSLFFSLFSSDWIVLNDLSSTSQILFFLLDKICCWHSLFFFYFNHCILQYKDFLLSSFNDFYLSIILPILFIYHFSDSIKLSFCFLRGRWASPKQLFWSFIRQIVDLYFFGVRCWKKYCVFGDTTIPWLFIFLSLELLSLHLKKQSSIAFNV